MVAIVSLEPGICVSSLLFSSSSSIFFFLKLPHLRLSSSPPSHLAAAGQAVRRRCSLLYCAASTQQSNSKIRTSIFQNHFIYLFLNSQFILFYSLLLQTSSTRSSLSPSSDPQQNNPSRHSLISPFSTPTASISSALSPATGPSQPSSIRPSAWISFTAARSTSPPPFLGCRRTPPADRRRPHLHRISPTACFFHNTPTAISQCLPSRTGAAIPHPAQICSSPPDPVAGQPSCSTNRAPSSRASPRRLHGHRFSLLQPPSTAPLLQQRRHTSSRCILLQEIRPDLTVPFPELASSSPINSGTGKASSLHQPASFFHLHQSSRLPTILPLSSSTVHCSLSSA